MVTVPHTHATVGTPSSRLSTVVSGTRHSIGTGFSATLFSADMFGGGMDPLLMVDHFVMTQPTFPPHRHAGMSAVTMLFEDTQGIFLNQDTLGGQIKLEAGDIYWLAAASGAVHEEKPLAGSRIHGLQIFIDMPSVLKHSPALSHRADASDIPIFEEAGYRARVASIDPGNATIPTEVARGVKIIDARLQPRGCFSYRLASGHQAWIYAVDAPVVIVCGAESRPIVAGAAVTVTGGEDNILKVRAADRAHVVLISGRPVASQPEQS